MRDHAEQCSAPERHGDAPDDEGSKGGITPALAKLESPHMPSPGRNERSADLLVAYLLQMHEGGYRLTGIRKNIVSTFQMGEQFPCPPAPLTRCSATPR